MIFVKKDCYFFPYEQKIIVHNTKHNGKIQHTKYLEVRQDDNFAERTIHPYTPSIRCSWHAWNKISTNSKSNKQMSTE